MDAADSAAGPGETFSPWTVVNLVFHHLAELGLHPVLGGPEPPGEPAAELLRRLGITPLAGGDSRTTERIRDELAHMRSLMPEQEARPTAGLSHPSPAGVSQRDTRPSGTGL